jgi:hypothetical protein
MSSSHSLARLVALRSSSLIFICCHDRAGLLSATSPGGFLSSGHVEGFGPFLVRRYVPGRRLLA